MLPVLLPEIPQPLDPDPNDSAAADTPLPDEAEPVPEHASSWSKMSSKSLDIESASLFWASIRDSTWGWNKVHSKLIYVKVVTDITSLHNMSKCS